MAQKSAPDALVDVQQLRAGLQVSRECFARMLDVSAKTIERWEKQHEQPSHPYQKARLAQIKEIADLGLIVYTPEGFHLFLTTPMPVFDGQTGIQMIESGRGHKVLSALAADYEGLGY